MQGSATSPVEGIAATLIKQMRTKFGEAAKDVLAQEAIASEVKDFMTKYKHIQDTDLASLEESIRLRLSGRTPPRKTMVMERKARIDGDEWARIWVYEAERVNRELARDRDIDTIKKAWQRKLLQEQMQEKEAIAEAERAADRKIGEELEADVESWKQDEAARHARAHEKVLLLKAQQEEQIAEKAARLRQARAKRAQEEADSAARLAYEVSSEFQKEAAARADAKKALVVYLAGNEEYKEKRAAAVAAQREEDLEYMRKYEEILDKQQKERQARLDKLKIWQEKSEKKVATMPESKRWMDPELLHRDWEAAEAAKDAEQQRRRAVVVEGKRRMVSALNKQVAERLNLHEQERRQAKEEGEKFMATAAMQEARVLEEKRRRVAHKLQAKLELEAQMRENARRMRDAPMSDVEKLVNKPLMGAIAEFERTGKLPLKPYPAEFLPRMLHGKQHELNQQHAAGRLKTALV